MDGYLLNCTVDDVCFVTYLCILLLCTIIIIIITNMQLLKWCIVTSHG